MDRVSVVIPVYNVEAYLDECVKSVLYQSYENIEIVLVNDGSTDNSGVKCDEWAHKDSRIRVVHKKNGGLSDARNEGVKWTSGSYVLFLDSDDFWDDTEAVSKLMKRVSLTNADVLNFSYKKYYEDTGEKILYFKNPQEMPLGLSAKEQFDYLTERGVYITSACNKLVKKALMDNNDLTFRKGVFSEDMEYCLKLLCVAKSMDFLPESFYCYRYRKNSISNTITEKKCIDLRDNIMRCMTLMDTVPDEAKTTAYRYMAYQYGTFFAVQAQAENVQTEHIQDLQQYKWVLRYHGGNLKVRALYYCCNIVGYKNTCRLMRWIYRKK